jgi:hypothetical protein
MSADLAGLAERHGVDPRFDDPGAYGPNRSHYGDGKYPPDWPARREAVWEFQKFQCGRCGTYKGDAAVTEVHHVHHLQHGGTNRLDNLVGLCGDCHSLMHPDVGDLRGDYRRAPVYPSEYSRDQVAVLRAPIPGVDGSQVDVTDWRRDLQLLGSVSSPGANRNAVTEATVPTSPELARRADEFQDVLVENGYVPLTTDYHRVTVEPRFPGLRGVLTDYRPEVSVHTEADVVTRGWEDESCLLRFTEGATETYVAVTGEDGFEGRHRFDFDEFDSDGSGARIRIEQRTSPPPLSTETLPGYLRGALRYFVAVPFLLGFVALAAVMLLEVATLPTSLPFVLVAALLVGNLLRLPWLIRDVRMDPETRVVDERANE